jgi:5-hydroxyisourate hydrolase
MHGQRFSQGMVNYKDIPPFQVLFATVVPLSLGSVAMGQLTTHVLDISAGLPAGGLRIDVHAWLAHGSSGLPEAPTLVTSVTTGTDGRVPKPLLAGTEFRAGRYMLTFHVAGYFRARGVTLPDPAFIEEAVIRIGIAHPDQHYHVPLLIAPWSYSVYRGG